VATAKRHHIAPFAYLRDVFARISAHPQNRLEELLPDRWAARWSAADAQMGSPDGYTIYTKPDSGSFMPIS